MSGRSNQTQCCQWLTITVAFLRKGAVLPAGAMMQRLAPPTHCTLPQTSASIMQDLI